MDIISGALSLLNNFSGNHPEKRELELELGKVNNSYNKAVLDYEKKFLDAQSKLIEQDNNSDSWIKKNWRPITMLTFLFLIVLDSFGLLVNRLNDMAWTLMQIGIGGYVIGRSAESVAPNIMKVFKK